MLAPGERAERCDLLNRREKQPPFELFDHRSAQARHVSLLPPGHVLRPAQGRHPQRKISRGPAQIHEKHSLLRLIARGCEMEGARCRLQARRCEMDASNVETNRPFHQMEASL